MARRKKAKTEELVVDAVEKKQSSQEAVNEVKSKVGKKWILGSSFRDKEFQEVLYQCPRCKNIFRTPGIDNICRKCGEDNS